jgi:indolepyruvate ferredoxin oxidoreductase beta subunit
MYPCLPEEGDRKGRGAVNSSSEKQKILISGVGGQGILFITRLLAEAAIYKGLPVLTAETHGMAQRGGIVMSHLKVGGFSSPLIRPGKADVLLLLHEENLKGHLYYLAHGGIVIANSVLRLDDTEAAKVISIDAASLAKKIQQPKSANLILTGFALSSLSRIGNQPYCSPDDIRAVLCQKMAGRDKILRASLDAFDLGMLRGQEAKI